MIWVSVVVVPLTVSSEGIGMDFDFRVKEARALNRVFHSRTFFLFYIGVGRSGFQIMLNSPVFFISREKKYLGFPPRENVKKTLFFVIFLGISRYRFGKKLWDSER